MSCPLPEPDPFPFLFRVDAAARTDRGLERDGNEDAAAFVDLGRGRVFRPPAEAKILAPACGFAALVCDGMGGEVGGEIASALAVETITAHLAKAFARRGLLGEEPSASSREIGLARDLSVAIEDAGRRIRDEVRRRPELARMGTTATLVAIARRRLVCAHVGDSRAYLFRRGVLRALTRDQTMAEWIRQSGALSPDAAAEIGGSHVILQAVGSSERLDVALSEVTLEDGDVFLVCSDGLSGVVDDAVVAGVLARGEDPSRAAETLVEAALARGGPDNVTCIVGRFTPAS